MSNYLINIIILTEVAETTAAFRSKFIHKIHQLLINCQNCNQSIDVSLCVSLNVRMYKPGPQSRALCGTVCALSIAIVLY